MLISYLSEDADAKDTARYVEEAGQRAVLVKGDLADAQHCRDIIATAVDQLGGVDILVNNAAYQMTRESLEEIPDEEWDYTFDTNIRAMFHLCKAAVPHMKPGSSIIGSSSVNSDMPSPQLAPYAATKAAIANFCASLAQMLGEKGIRVNSVAPGPIWTPLIPATMPPEKVEKFGSDTRSAAPASRSSWPRSTCCSPPTPAATSPGQDRRHRRTADPVARPDADPATRVGPPSGATPLRPTRQPCPPWQGPPLAATQARSATAPQASGLDGSSWSTICREMVRPTTRDTNSAT